MNSSAMVDSIMSASVGSEAAMSRKASSLPAGGEPKRAFADTPPLARIRNESRSCKVDSSEVSPEGEVASEQAVGCEPLRQNESPRPEGQEALVAGEPTQVSGEPGPDLVATLTTENLAGQAESPAGAASVAGAVNTTSAAAETGPVETVIVNCDAMEGLPAMPRVGPEVEVEAQGPVNTEDTVIESGLAQADMSASTAENPLDTLQTATQVQGDEGSEKSLNLAEVSASAIAESDQSRSVAESGGTIARDQAADVAGSDASPAAPDRGGKAADIAGPDASLAAPDRGDKAADIAGPDASLATSDRGGKAAPAAMGTAAVVQTQSEQQVSSENPNGSNLNSGQQAPATAEMTGPDATGPLPGGEHALPRENTGNQPEGPVQVVVTESQAKAGAFSNTEEGTKAPPELSIDSQSSVPVSEPASMQAGAVADAETASGKSPVQNVGEQILDSVHASLTRGDRQLVVRLDPPELGSVTVRFQEQDGQISAVLEVNRDQTRQEVEQALPQVLRGLQEAGVLVRRVDVVVADQSERDLGRESTPQDAWAQQEDSDRRDTRPGPSSAGRWSTWTAQQQGSLEQSEASLSEIGAAQGRIDMLI